MQQIGNKVYFVVSDIVKSMVFAVAIMMAACSNQESFDSNLPQPVKQQTCNIRSFEEALQIAQASIGIVDGQPKTRAASPRKISLSDSKVCLADNKTRSANVNDTLMYVFNFEDNQGFAVVSASRSTEGLLAVTEKGSYDPEEESDNKGFNLFMKMAGDYVSKATLRDHPLPIVPILWFKEEIDTIASSQAGPYVTVQWGQTHPEGEFCPNGIAGCVNTAAVQLMSYYEHPTSITIDYPNADVSIQQLDWTAMKAHPTGAHPSMYLCPDTTAHYALARLFRQVGKMTFSDYSDPTKTSSNLGFAKGALRLLGYTVSETNCSPSMLNSSSYYANKLDNGYMYLLAAAAESGGAHAWVCDGYNYDYSRHYYYIRDENLEWYLEEVRDIETYLFHMNWGWYGDCNGYFLPKVFNTQGAQQYDGTNYASYNFSNTSVITVEEVSL